MVKEKLTNSIDKLRTDLKSLVQIDFEKDDDHHVQFVIATSNLRAKNYGIEQADWLKVFI